MASVNTANTRRLEFALLPVMPLPPGFDLARGEDVPLAPRYRYRDSLPPRHCPYHMHRRAAGQGKTARLEILI